MPTKIAASGTASAAARCTSPVSTPTTNRAPAIRRAADAHGLAREDRWAPGEPVAVPFLVRHDPAPVGLVGDELGEEELVRLFAARGRERLGRQRRVAARGGRGRDKRDDPRGASHGTTSTSTAVETPFRATWTVTLPGERARRRRRSAEPSRSTLTTPSALVVHVASGSPASRCA